MTENAPARFDAERGAWILTTYADVSVALRDERLSLAGAGDNSTAALTTFRDVVSHALSSQRLAVWRAAMVQSARRFADALHDNQPVDLVTAFARPWSIEVAAIIAGATRPESTRLAASAHEIFLAAANATNSDPQPDTHRAIAKLSRGLAGPDPVIAVQTFVALTQTLPCLLAGAWLALLSDAELMHRLRTTPNLVPRAVDELLRITSPSRAVFRCADADISIGAAKIASGERVILMISAANLDAAQFSDPTHIDPSRGSMGHLALGMGMHPCLGASLVRAALTCATTALLDATTCIELAGQVDWLDGFAIRAPTSLPVVLRRAV